MIYLRQSTAGQEVQIGKFVDDTDFKTAETALSIANTDVKLHKEGATSQASKNSGGATHIANGWYYVVLDATDTNTIGNLQITVDVSGALSVMVRCVVLDEAVYDVLFGTTAPSTYAGADTSGTTTLLSRVGGALTITSGRVNADVTHIATAAVSTTTAQLGVNVVQVSGDATAADNAEAFFDGTGYAGTNNVIPTVTTVTNRVSANTDQLAGQTVTAAAGVTFPTSVASPTNITAGTITTATNVTTVNGLAANVITASALASDAVAEIQSGLSTYAGGDTSGTTTLLSRLSSARAGYLDNLSGGAVATAANLATVAGYLDAKIAAILEDTGTTLPAQIAALSFSTHSAADVWDHATRTLTSLSGLTLDTVTTLTNLPTIPANWLTAAGTASDFGTEIGTAVWASATRTLTSSGSGGATAQEVWEYATRTLTANPGLTAAQVNAEVDTALADYDPPTNAEMVARTLAAADYATAAAVGDVPTNAELATALAAADDAVLAAVAGLSIPTANANADALLARNIAGGSSTGRTVGQALAASRNKVTRVGSTLTVYDTDDTTVLWTATITTDADAEPLTGVDPG